jgi:uncharacterized phage protein (TIGR01671 family)
MREIKFRAWDSLHGEMLHNPSLSCKNGEWNIRQKGPSTLEDVDFELEQFTGLRDRNGREIYEGDVARLTSNRVSEIRYQDGGFGFVGWGDFIGFAGHNHLRDVLAGIEVVGNIHENPDLLRPTP